MCLGVTDSHVQFDSVPQESESVVKVLLDRLVLHGINILRHLDNKLLQGGMAHLDTDTHTQ